MMPAELKTAAEVRAHARIVGRRISQQLHAARPAPPAAASPAPPSPPSPPAPSLPSPPPPPALQMVRGYLVHSLLKLSADYFNLPVAAVMSHKREAELSLARHVAFYVARHLGAQSTIAANVAKRDHSSIHNSVDVIRRRIAAGDRKVIVAVDALGLMAAASLNIQWTSAELHLKDKGSTQ